MQLRHHHLYEDLPDCASLLCALIFIHFFLYSFTNYLKRINNSAHSTVIIRSYSVFLIRL